MPLLLALLACGAPSEPDAPPTGAAPAPGPTQGACLHWHGPAVRLSPDGPGPRHHPTVARTDDGLLVAWQIGKNPADVAVRAFADALSPRGDEVPLSDGRRATHPQVAWAGGRGGVAWTREDDGALRWRPIDAAGAISGEARVLAPGRTRPALYPDVSLTADNARLFWFRDHPEAAWSVLDIEHGDRVDVPVLPDSVAGGPGAVRHAPDGTAWLVWPELRPDEPGGESRLRAWRLDVDPQPLELHRSPHHFQRPALGFVTDSVVAAWTRYPTRTAGWGVWVGAWALDGAPRVEPERLDRRQGRMADLDALDDAVVVAWEEPVARADRDIVAQVFGPSLTERCGPVVAHEDSSDEETRANLALWRSGNGVTGVLVWQAGPHAREQAVWGRRFDLL